MLRCCLLLSFCFVAALAFDRSCIECSYEASYIPEGFEVLSVSKDFVIPLHIAVKQRNVDILSATLTEVSEISSEYYGQYLSWEEITEMVSNPIAKQEIIQWLTKNNINDWEIKGTGDWIVAKTTVAQAEQLLQTSFSKIRTNQGQEIVRALQPYTVPTPLAKHIDLIGGVHGFVGKFL